jgi:hypothetical protein
MVEGYVRQSLRCPAQASFAARIGTARLGRR